MIPAFIIAASILAYAFVGGGFGWLFFKTAGRRCHACQAAEATKKARYSYEREKCYSDHGVSATFAGFGWPLVLPAIAGGMVTNHFTTKEQRAKNKAAHKDREHQNRLAELEAERVLAREQKEKTLADIRFLAENGIKAEVPGLYEES